MSVQINSLQIEGTIQTRSVFGLETGVSDPLFLERKTAKQLFAMTGMLIEGGVVLNVSSLDLSSGHRSRSVVKKRMLTSHLLSICLR